MILTDALIYAVNAYTRAWTAFHDPVAIPTITDGEREDAARRSALDLAWWYRHTGRTRPASLILTPEAETAAAAHAAVAMVFLLAHEIGHVVAGHLDAVAPACLNVTEVHELVAAGTPGDGTTHPLAMRRLLALLSALDEAEHDRVFRGLTESPADFWLLRA